jgi:hypothetical protein
MTVSPLPRPDSWVESLAIQDTSADALEGLVATLVRQMTAFGVVRPLVLVGDRTGRPAIESLRAASGLAVEAVESFSLYGNDLGDGVSVAFPDAARWAAHDGVICLDADGGSYMNAVQFCYDQGLDLTVLTDFDAMPGQFCQTSVLSGEMSTDIYIYNYYAKMYRVKDPLQLLWRVHWDSGAITRGSAIMAPNGSVVLTPQDLGLPAEGDGGTIVHEVHHPAFARVPNSRFRSYIDVVAPASFVCHHGDEVTPKRVEAGGWFDTHSCLLGGDHDLLIGVRKDVMEPQPITVRLSATPVEGGTERSIELRLDGTELQKGFSVCKDLGISGPATPYRVVCELHGRGYRMAWTEAYRTDGRLHLVGNHGSSNDPHMAALISGSETPAADPVLLSRLQALESRRVLPLPYPLPVLPASSRLRFAFSAQKFLPLLDAMTIAAFNADGTLVGVEKVSLPQDLGYLSVDDTPFAAALAERGGLLLISPPYGELGLVAYQNCREDLWIKLEDKTSGDSDITEFQIHNRNLRGYTVPIGFGQAPQQIKSRSDLLIRYRVDAPRETILYLINASPELDFDRTAEVELEFNAANGASASITLQIPPQGVREINVADVLPASIAALGPHGWVRVLSDNAALSVYCGLVDATSGAVGLQHLLGA